VYLSIDDGIGSGLIINGKVFRGNSGSAGEFGHFTIDENGPLCRCGNRGCLETYVGGPALIESLRGNHRGLKLHDIVVRAIAGDPKCIRAIADAGRHIGVAAANLCNIVDPSRLVVGGELSQSGELLLGPMRHALERAVIVGPDSVPDIVQSQLGARAEMLGAIALAIDRVSITSSDPAGEPA
jgi:predicted NBD/HSP70 family sugar kinase